MNCMNETSDNLDFKAQDLSIRVIKKFAPLFRDSKSPDFSHGLTAITLTKKTENDMTGYSEDIEIEREEYFPKFISNANFICDQLIKSGFWADFIDPYSGQPFLVIQCNSLVLIKYIINDYLKE